MSYQRASVGKNINSKLGQYNFLYRSSNNV